MPQPHDIPRRIGVERRAPAVTHDQLEELAELVADRVVGRRAPQLIDARTAATLLGVPATWVLAEARADRIPHVRLGRYVRFETQQLVAWWATKQHG